MGNTGTKWYILYTKKGSEKRVANFLSRKNIENYFPLKKQISVRGKVSMEPLFVSFVFVAINDNNLQTARAIDGVINYAYWLGKPAVIKEEEIELMKLFLNEYSTINVEKIPFNLNGNLRVVGETFIEEHGQIASVKNNSVRIILPSIGYYMIAELEKSNVEILAPKKQAMGIFEKFQFAV